MKRFFSIQSLFLTVMLIVSSFSTHAATITVTNSMDMGAGSLRMAVMMAVAGDDIVFDAATDGNPIMLTTEIVIDKALTITGNGPGTTTIDGMGMNRIFNVTSDATIANLTLTGANNMGGNGGAIINTAVLIVDNVAINGNAANNGAGIYNDGGTVTVQNGAVITMNDVTGAAASGGGIFNDGTLTVTDSEISANTAIRAGGGIEARDGSTTTLTNVTLNNNSTGATPGNGGGLHITAAGNATITGGTVNGNTAAAEGGGLWNGTGTMTIDGTTIDGNTASGAPADQGGGGVFNANGTIDIDNAIITNNTADGAAGSGGGILNDDGILTVDNSNVSNNTSVRAGGGIEVNGPNAATALTNVTLNLNATAAAPGNGGGMHVTGTSDSSVTGGTVNGNTATAEGGGLWNDDGTMTINGTTIDGNTASGAPADQGGGGVFNDEGTIDIDGATITNNTANGAAGSGGGILNNDGILTVDASTIANNSSMRAGGGIEVVGANALTTLTDVLLNSNSTGAAPGNGGGIHITGSSDSFITNGTVNSNTAAAEGGGLWNGTGTMTIANVAINVNTASGAAADQGGGGVFNAGGTVNITGGTIDGNIADGAAGSGGGILNDAMGTLTVDGTTIANNRANRAGGGIEVTGGTTNTITNAIIVLNNAGVAPATAAPGNGGGIHISGDGNMDITGGVVNENLAAREGGGLWNGAGTMNVDNVAINANDAQGTGADDGGGGIFNNGGILNVTGGTIANNMASGATGGSGGGILNLDGTMTVNGTTISGNTAQRAGGGIEATAASTNNLTNVLLNINSAGPSPGNGGGMHITGAGTATIIGGTVNGNIAAREGGGLWNGSGTMTITGGTTIDGNDAQGGAAPDDGGGGIFNNMGTLIVDGGTTITNNTASSTSASSPGTAGSGGGILNFDGTVTLEGITIAGNSAVRAGGGIEATANATTNLNLVALNNNTTGASPGNGGGFHQTGGGTSTINQTVVDGNSAANEGGGLWGSGAGLMTVTNSTISNNNAPDGGGLFLQAAAGTMNVTNSTVSGNTATNGGGVQVEGGTLNLESTTIASNTATTGGGVNVLAGAVNANNNIIGDNGDDFNGAFATATFNVLEDDTNATGIMDGVNGNIVGFDPQLMPLADNGGPTQTHLPTGASPALDRGNSSEGLDQRGQARPAGGVTDMGAVEVQVGELSNDMCAGAFMPFECGDLLFGTTGTATAAGAPTPCDPLNGANQPGVFFTFEGTGFRTTISTDFPGTNFDTEINVYSGDCNNLTCIGGDDNSGLTVANASDFSFQSLEGTTYFVYVTGEGGAQGQFQIGFDARLDIICRPPVSGTTDEGTCSAAFELISPVLLEGECMLGDITSDAPAAFPIGETLVTWTVTSADPDGPDPVTCTQLVTINDEEAPVIDCPASINLYTSWDNCGYPASILGSPTATDNCTGNPTITADPTNLNFYAPGQYMRNFTATDAAGNSSMCMQWVKVYDTTDPKLLTCPDDITVDAQTADGATVTFANPTGMDNCPGGLIQIGNFESGDNFPLGVTDVEILLYDQYGNDVACNFTVTVQAGDPNVATTVAGMMATESVETVMDVEVYINGTDGMNSMNMTLEDGLYDFSVPMGGDYSITPVKDIDVLNGVSTYDLVLINKHILGIQPLATPYQMIAADVNRTNSITTLDLVHMQKLILFINDEFPNNTSWRFVTKAFEFADPTNPFAQDIPEIININNIDQAQLDADFVAVKIGDVNGNATVNLLGADDRTVTDALTFNTANTRMTAGETYEIALTAADFDHTGFQFTMNFDQEKVAFEGITSDLGKANNFGLTKLDNGAITVSWYDATAPVLTLTLTAKTDATLAEVLNINSRFTTAEAYTTDGNLENVELTFENEVASAFKMYQNVPNPFANTTMIGFDLPTATTATITVSDVSGRVVYSMKNDFAKGFNQVEINRANLPSSGVWYYSVKTDANFATGKMILID